MLPHTGEEDRVAGSGQPKERPPRMLDHLSGGAEEQGPKSLWPAGTKLSG
jgi:hypothetical protein